MNGLQIQASDPNYSVWVLASAGTGKTKILTDRVLRLIINNVEVKKILCITFTNAASCEMQSRISSALSHFASIDELSLRNELHQLIGRYPTIDEIINAKTAYYKLLNSDDDINVYTIHSYCQKILKSFPIEIGINPAFEVLDEFAAQELLSQIKNKLFLDERYEKIVEFFVKNCHETVLDEVLNQILAQKLKFKQLGRIKAFIFPNENIVINTSYDKLFFLTKDGNKRKNLGKNCTPELLKTQDLVYKLDQQEKMKATTEYTEYLLKFATIFLNCYEEYKSRYSLLDYDDLIYYTHKLLINEKAKDWLSYKLEGGIDHLLIDEAQDTSKEQWQIIESIITDFSSKKNRTIFVVGDEKQSIFSFQGADLEAFREINNQLRNKLLKAEKDFHVVNLETSYRSTGEILDAVYNIFEKIKFVYPELFPIPNIKISPYRKHSGKVELWPLVKANKKEEISWPLPEQFDNSLSPKKRLAKQIAMYIRSQIDQKIILPSTNLAARPQDFMILIRKRDNFTIEIINQLKAYNLEVLGLDRILLNENLLVLDLISAAKFVLNPKDDLNLACLLKSSLIGLTDYDLEYLRTSKALPLYECILLERNKDNFKNAYKILTLLTEIYKYITDSNFFSILVDRLDIRSKIIASGGYDSIDVINEFLYLTMNYASTIKNSLQSFLYWFDTNKVEIKRSIENTNKIKIMTIHGAKGLQSPVVILADTTSTPINQNKFFWLNRQEILAPANANTMPQLIKDLKEKESFKELQEYLRLLYVALTRAEDHLIVCGYSNYEEPSRHCWYNLVALGVKTNKYTSSNLCEQEIENKLINKTSNLLNHNISWFSLSDTSLTFHNDENNSLSILNNLSPLEANFSLEYGQVLHKILEDTAKLKDTALLKIHPLITSLPTNLQKKFYKNIELLLVNKEFLDLFNQKILTEVNIGVMENNKVKTYRIDLLAINDKQITIIDYKSDINPPLSSKLVPIKYIEQLNSYRLIIQKIYPEYEIMCKILWLENSKFSVL